MTIYPRALAASIGLAIGAIASPALGNVAVSMPAAGATVTSPVHYQASATTTTCAKGVASMGIYVNNKLIYVVNATTLNTSISLATGAEHTVVEEWDNCGGATYTTIDLTIKSSTVAAPTVSIFANSTTITSGSSATLTVSAANATAVSVSGSDGKSYTLSATGGTQSVTPVETTTYTAKATGGGGSATAQAVVTVIDQSSLSAVSHVVFMLQENHTFDDYFGMLNPYRAANGWEIGDDGATYKVDGIDDKLTTISNDDDQNATYKLFKFKSSCVDDMTSDWLASYGDVNRYNFLATRPINLDGYVHNAEGFADSCNASAGGDCSGVFTDTTGERSMGYYDGTFLNYYYYMASQFAVSDRWFSPVASKSIDNRIAVFTGGTTQGLVNDPTNDDHLSQLAIPTIFNELDAAKVTWKIYYTVTQGFCLEEDDCPTTGDDRYPATDFSDLTYSYQYLYQNPTHAACKAPAVASSAVGDVTNSFCIDTAHIAPLSTYYSDLTNGTLPSFSFIEAGYGNNDEHPGSGQEILEGQAQVAKVVNAFMASPEWKSSVFFLSYDEGGGPYDHVPPVPGHSNANTDSSLGAIRDVSAIAVAPDSYKPCVPANGVATTHCDLSASDPGANSSDAAAENGFAAQIGFRLPNIIISPFTKKHYVSHTPMDHTAVIKFVENRFISSSTHLTARDAAQPNLLEFFDFTAKPWSTPPTPPTPVSDETLGYNSCTPSNMGGE